MPPRKKMRTKSRKLRESHFYPVVRRWLEDHYRCFKTDSNKGLTYSRGDVFGVRDVGGDLSGEIETIAVEVKRGSEPFATASGQAFGYKVYANRVYLADVRPLGFTLDEVSIAGHLGIGLIAISQVGKGYGCREVLSSPRYQPLGSMHLRLLDKLELGACRVCGCFFELGANFTNTRQRFRSAVQEDKGLRFWNYALAARKVKKRLVKRKDDGTSYERRYVCPDCVQSLAEWAEEVAPDAFE